MGRAIAAATLRRKGIEAVGAVDVAKGIVGRDLGAVAGMGPVGVTVSGDAQDLLSRVGADIVLHATVSRLPEALPQLAECLRARANVISTCEELSYPYRKYPHLAAELDLSPDQRTAVSATMAAMQGEARRLGEEILAQERALDQTFTSRTITQSSLATLTAQIARLQGELRFVHLRAHLAVRAVLSDEQVRRYDSRRGYAGSEVRR